MRYGARFDADFRIVRLNRSRLSEGVVRMNIRAGKYYATAAPHNGSAKTEFGFYWLSGMRIGNRQHQAPIMQRPRTSQNRHAFLCSPRHVELSSDRPPAMMRAVHFENMEIWGCDEFVIHCEE